MIILRLSVNLFIKVKKINWKLNVRKLEGGIGARSQMYLRNQKKIYYNLLKGNRPRLQSI